MTRKAVAATTNTASALSAAQAAGRRESTNCDGKYLISPHPRPPCGNTADEPDTGMKRRPKTHAVTT